MRKIASHIKSDPILYAALILSVVSAFIVPPSVEYISYLDLRVLALLFSLMLVVAGLQKGGAFDAVTARLLSFAKNARALTAMLVGVCFVTSMLVTNDVALITFVPLAISLLCHVGMKDKLIIVIVLQTIAANLGSMLTPLGNPQNLYIYSLSGMSPFDFMRVLAMPT
ncbi:MAG: citrate transporter, partial [Clostridia bacterium]|nr:citrate transporter [Clostridia bacterium]